MLDSLAVTSEPEVHIFKVRCVNRERFDRRCVIIESLQQDSQSAHTGIGPNSQGQSIMVPPSIVGSDELGGGLEVGKIDEAQLDVAAGDDRFSSAGVPWATNRPRSSTAM